MTDKQPLQDYFKAILLVDDNEATNYIHKYYLGKWGINATIYTAVDGKEAINFLKTNTEFHHQSPSLILLDINMPVMDGFEFMEQYQQLSTEHKSTMVIFMLTTSLHPSDRQRASQFKELKGYLHKPLDQDQFESIINTAKTSLISPVEEQVHTDKKNSFSPKSTCSFYHHLCRSGIFYFYFNCKK